MKNVDKARARAGFLPLIFALIAGQAAAQDPMMDRGSDPGLRDRHSIQARQACTIIYAADDQTALAGNNEDWTSLFGTIWFQPADEGKFGRVYFGWRRDGRHIPQGGMNDQGLFWDGATAENVVVPRDPAKPRPDTELIFKAMEECATVEEVLDLFSRYDQSGTWNGHYLVGDRFGHSAIIEPLTVIRKTGKFQAVSNFFQSKTPPEKITDARYRIVADLLGKPDKLSVDLFRRVLNAVHWEEYSGSMTVTLYSYICDLKKGEVYVYNFHNFEDVVRIKLQEELRKGERFQSIRSLFPYDTFAAKRYRAQRIVGLLHEQALEKGVAGDGGALALFKEIKQGVYETYGLTVVEEHLLALAEKLLLDGKTREAVETLAAAAGEYPSSDYAFQFLGQSVEEAARRELAIKNFKPAEAFDLIGDAYWKAGSRELALQSFRKALEIDPGDAHAKEMLGIRRDQH